MTESFSLDFPYAYGKPVDTARFRSENEDFIVDEHLDVAFSQEGEHLYLQIKKNGENTHWVAEQLANYFKVKANDVGYSGKKDRHAVTSQWFSVYLPGIREIPSLTDIEAQVDAEVTLLDAAIHRQKLRLGTHQSNAFKICLRDIAYSDDVEERLRVVSEGGVPNYFGEQRFGRDMNNLQLAEEWFSGQTEVRNRNKRGMVLSASRSYLFNLVVARRVSLGSWNQLIDGDVAENGYPSSPMWGRGRSETSGAALQIEAEVLEPYAQWRDVLEHKGLKQERRSIVTMPEGLTWQFSDNNLMLEFSLPSGQFATSVLREIAILV